ncbi:MAG: 23S rRNA (guanosine(2251)-2'-O)-methyltransferase RlmB [Gammaproteobacteria bacterium]
MKTSRYVYGLHAVAGLLANRPESVTTLSVAEGAVERRLEGLLEQAAAARIPIHRLPRAQLDRLLPGARHQGVVATLREPAPARVERDLPAFLSALDEPAFLLVLDGVQDPHNLGACLRTADAAGVHAVILPRDRAAGITPVVHKVASGAADSMPLFSVTNLARTLRRLREAGIWIYGTSDTGGQELYTANLAGPAAFVLGSEGRGMRRLTRDCCDYLLSIPMAGQVESLNVSVAAGVLLFEALRQRRQGERGGSA